MTCFAIGAGRLHRSKITFTHKRVRPTRQVVREAIVNLLVSRNLVQGKKIYLPFAGSGITGFDLYSAGAQSLTFVDNDTAVISQLNSNARELDIACTVHRGSARRFVPEAHDVVLADPPYRSGWAEDPRWITDVVRATRTSVFVLESEKQAHAPEELFGEMDTNMILQERLEKTYGETRLTIFLFRVQ